MPTILGKERRGQEGVGLQESYLRGKSLQFAEGGTCLLRQSLPVYSGKNDICSYAPERAWMHRKECKAEPAYMGMSLPTWEKVQSALQTSTSSKIAAKNSRMWSSKKKLCRDTTNIITLNKVFQSGVWTCTSANKTLAAQDHGINGHFQTKCFW